MKVPGLLAAALLLLPACSSPGGGETPRTPPPADTMEPPAGTAPAAAVPAAGAPGGPEVPAPAALEEGDRWFVMVRAARSDAPVAERSRRRRVDGVLREEVTWGPSFAAVAGAEHGVAQAFALFLDGKGLSVSLIDGEGRPTGDPRTEIAAPFRVGTVWTVRDGRGREIEGRIAALEKAETPGGPVECLRVEARIPPSRRPVVTTWYDRGLRPVRSEIRGVEDGRVVEASAALASADPTPEECRAAVEWAKKGLPEISR